MIFTENLWHHLKRLGLNESDEKDPLFGSTKQALEALVQQRLVLPYFTLCQHYFSLCFLILLIIIMWKVMKVRPYLFIY